MTATFKLNDTNNFASTEVTVGGKKKNLSLVTLNAFDVGDKKRQSYHEINLLDRSGSMYSDLDKAVDVLISHAEMVRKVDGYLSVGYFASPGQYKMILSAVKVTEDVIKHLNTLRSTLGCTCFSEILKSAEDLVGQTVKVADLTVINLLTDGQAVVTDVRKELATCREIAARMGTKKIRLNTIGFGHYYDRDFLKDLATASYDGRFVHVNDTSFEYADRLGQLLEESNDVLKCKLVLKVDQDATFMYQSGKFVAKKGQVVVFDELTSDYAMHEFFIVTDDKLTGLHVELDDAQFDLTPKGKIGATTKTQAMYGLAYMTYRDNDRLGAFQIAKSQLKDKYLTRMIGESLTNQEVGNTMNALYDATFMYDKRELEGKCGPSFMATGSKFSVLDVLASIASSESLFAFNYDTPGVTADFVKARDKYVTDYKRTTRKVTDEQNSFTRKAGHLTSDFDGLVFSEDRLNVSVRYTIEGTVELNKRAADRVGLDINHPSYMYRNMTIVKDGNLNHPVIEMHADPEIYKLLTEVNKTYKGFIRAQAGGTFLIDFSKLPLVKSTSVPEFDKNAIAEVTRELSRLAITQKGLKYALDELPDAVEKKGEFKSLTADQIKVLEDHGINYDGSYSGIANKAATADQSDSYQTREIKTQVVGFASLPSLNAIKKKLDANKKPTPSEQAVLDAYTVAKDAVAGMSNAAARKYLRERIRTNRRELLVKRGELSSLKMTTVLNRAWFDGIVLDEKNSAPLADDVVLKVAYVTEYI